MKRYAKYKDSGISWIGEVPEHWEVSSLRKHLTFISDKGHPKEQLLSVTREEGVIVRNVESKEENHNYIPEDLSGYKLVKKGQFAINKMKSWQGSYAVSEYTGIVSPAYFICDLRFDYKPFFNAAIRSRAYIPFFTMYSKGIRVDQWDLSPIGLKSIPFFIPPLSEQKAIAEFLDNKTKQINELVAAKKKQIELLKEYKQAVIAKAVTQGVNPKTKMKDSGISWIGQIPEHWGVTRNKTFLLEKDDVVGKSNDYQLLSLTKGGVIIRDVESGKGKFPKDFESYKIVHSDDVVFCLFDVDETPRTVGLSKYNGMITGAYDIFQLQNINSEFYTYYFIAIDDRKALRPLYTGLRKVVKKDRFLSYKIAVPPLPEQEQIVAYIKEKVSAIDSQISSIEKQIANLNEYKQSLISDVVTGKVKVA